MTRPNMNPQSRVLLPLALAGLVLTAGCMVGPTYKRANVPTPPAYKEEPPASFKETGLWKKAEPSDGAIKGKWWEIFNDPQLNALEEQVSISNQNLLQAEALYREARESVRIANAALWPTVSGGPNVTESRTPSMITSVGAAAFSTMFSNFSLPANISWAPDLWGRVRRNTNVAAANAQASAAQLENARLLFQSELAQDYFNLHGIDSECDLLTRTVKSYQEFLELTRSRFRGGVASDLDVAQAESQVETTQSQLTDLGVARAQMEHAIAVLTGKPPAALSIAPLVLNNPPPAVPVGVPSALLERRPDIAENERQMAAANEQIGIAKAAYYPSLSLSGMVGFSSSAFANWMTWPSRVFSTGPNVMETIFDAGRRRATLNETRDAYDATIAAYRQTVLTAFQEVEDSLAALRVLADETVPVQQAVSSSDRALMISTAQYKAGTTSYLTVTTAQATLLNAQVTAVNLLTRRLIATVTLIQALGGGWDASQLPTDKEVRRAASELRQGN